MINSLPSFSTNRVTLPEVPRYFEDLASKLKCQGPILVFDCRDSIPEALRALLGPRVAFSWGTSTNAPISMTREEARNERTRNAAVLVDIVLPLNASTQSRVSYSPVIELTLMSQNVTDTCYEDDREREFINKFFAKYSR